MAQHEMNLRDCWRIGRRRRFIIVVSTLLVALLSFWFSRQRLPVYESTASIRYERSTSLSGLPVEVPAVGGGDGIETQGLVIKSYPVLEEALRRMGKLPVRPAGQPMRESDAYLNALDALAAKIRTARVAGTSIIEVTASSTNPGEAREIAHTVAESYRDSSRQLRNGRITDARTYIEKQMQEAEARVKAAEEQVWAFREANAIISPGAESGVLLSLFTQVRSSIEAARQQRTEMELAQAHLARIDPGTFAERVLVDTTNPALQKLQTTQVELLLEHNNLALEVSEGHPRLQAMADRMREVRLEMRREIDAQIALLRNREQILTRRMGDILQKNRGVPTVELRLQRLQRDAKTSEDLLTLLRAKHQEALIKESERVEEVAIVRPATDPVKPVATDRFNTVLIGTLLGLTLGLVLAFVRETLDTSIGIGRRENVVGGLGLVLLLVAGVVGVTAWQLGWLARDGGPHALDRRVRDVLSARSGSVEPVSAPSADGLPFGPRAGAAAPMPSTPAAREAAAVAAGPRFAVEFGPFVTGAEAERTERQVNEAGHQTVRFRQQTGAALYSFVIRHGNFASREEAEARGAELGQQGLPNHVVRAK